MGSVSYMGSVIWKTRCYRLKLFPSCITNFTKGGKCLAHIQRLSSRRGTSTKPTEQNKAALKANLSSTMPARCLRQIPVPGETKTAALLLYILSLFIFPLSFSETFYRSQNQENIWCTYSFLSDPLGLFGDRWQVGNLLENIHLFTSDNNTLYFSLCVRELKSTFRIFLCLEKLNNKCDSSAQWGLSQH